MPDARTVAGLVEEAHRRHWAAVLAATVRLTRDLDLAEDCAQDAYGCGSSGVTPVGVW